MSDWKNEIDEHYKRKEEEEEKERARAKLAEEREYQKNLAELQRKFKCHICGRPAQYPYRDTGWVKLAR